MNLSDKAKCSLTNLFADDAKFLSIDGNQEALQSEFDKVFHRSQENRIIFNADKCMLMSFNKSESSTLSFEIEFLTTADSQKDLRLIINSKLNWLDHFKQRSRKAIQVFYMVKRNSPAISFRLKLIFLKSRFFGFRSNCDKSSFQTSDT